MMRKLKVLDLFSGIGGFSLGLERTGGFETVRFCEMKPHARAVLEKNFGPVPCDEDVTAMQFQQGEADVITAGFPCQDLSFAGDGAGLAGSRSGLYREVIRAIRVVRPLRAVLENVAALLSRGLGTVLGDLAKIRYDAEWHCIPASAVGAPHRRDRVWIVAHPRGKQHKSDSAPLSGTLSAQLSAAFAKNTQRMENTERFGRSEVEQSIPGGEIGEGSADTAEYTSQPAGRGWWAVEPGLGRVADGVPNRVDRLEEMGNAVVPQIPEMIGYAILEAERAV